MELFGVRLLGLTPENGYKLLLTLAFIVVAVLIRWMLVAAVRALVRPRHERLAFWIHQAVSLAVAILLVIGIVSIWFDDPGRLTTAAGLVTAGMAFALQKVITAVAGYFVILRGKTFSVGDRITMGGVRGDVIALGFVQTTIMEMGEPPEVQSADPAMWIRSRQFTGRIVTVTNDKIFDEPIYNYTRDFPFIWEEIRIPITYEADRAAVEDILLKVAEKHTATVTKLGHERLARLRSRYFVHDADIDPRVFYRLTDNWLELTVRFLVDAYSVRRVKDAMSREILAALEQRKIGIASTTMAIVEFPPLQLEAKKPS